LKLYFANENVVPAPWWVGLVNLPKKKNIDRDLILAFQGIPGITNIVPAVIGNEDKGSYLQGFCFY